MRTITFYATKSIRYDSYATNISVIKNTNTNVKTSQLCLISFDLLDYFDKIHLVVYDKTYELKLGKNDWIDKELRKEHNLFKIVQSNILNELEKQYV